MRFAQGAFALQVEGNIQDGFDFFFAEVQVADQITTVKIGLHNLFSEFLQFASCTLPP